MYTREQILQAAEQSKLPKVQAELLIWFLDGAKETKTCRECMHLFTNSFDQDCCHKRIDFDSVEDCEGELFEKK